MSEGKSSVTTPFWNLAEDKKADRRLIKDLHRIMHDMNLSPSQRTYLGSIIMRIRLVNGETTIGERIEQTAEQNIQDLTFEQREGLELGLFVEEVKNKNFGEHTLRALYVYGLPWQEVLGPKDSTSEKREVIRQIRSAAEVIPMILQAAQNPEHAYPTYVQKVIKKSEITTSQLAELNCWQFKALEAADNLRLGFDRVQKLTTVRGAYFCRLASWYSV